MKTEYWLKSHSLSSPHMTETGLFYQKKLGAEGTWVMHRQHQTQLSEPLLTDFQTTIGYGGRAWSVSKNGCYIAFCGKDRRVWRYTVASAQLQVLSPEFEGLGSPWIADDGERVLFAAESDGHCQIWSWSSQQLECLSEQSWYAWNPSSAHGHVVWSEWDQGVMPWEASRIVMLVDGKEQKIEYPGASLSYPGLTHDGQHLIYASDQSGSRQLWCYDLQSKFSKQLTFLETEVFRPDWVCGSQPWVQLSENDIAVIHHHRGIESVTRIQNFLETPIEQKLDIPVATIDAVTGDANRIVCAGHHDDHPGRLLEFQGVSSDVRELDSARVGGQSALSRHDLKASVVSWPADDGSAVHGVLRKAVGRNKAPLLLHIHGGPTSCETVGWRPEATYWNLKGWHWLSVNHRGSSGYGRAYQDCLQHQWGIVDVEDVCSAARYAVEQGLTDQIVLYGGSAGGWTVLHALLRDPELWIGGVALYPVSDLCHLAEHTHRFEESYNDYLVGDPKDWMERSPLTKGHRLQKPLLLCHGTEDKAVPLEQSERFFEATGHSSWLDFMRLEGQGHGFSMPAKQAVWQRMEQSFQKWLT